MSQALNILISSIEDGESQSFSIFTYNSTVDYYAKVAPCRLQFFELKS